LLNCAGVIGLGLTLVADRPDGSDHRLLDVIEFLDFAEAIGFDPRSAIKHLLSVKP
jgi:hypothetical protein